MEAELWRLRASKGRISNAKAVFDGAPIGSSIRLHSRRGRSLKSLPTATRLRPLSYSFTPSSSYPSAIFACLADSAACLGAAVESPLTSFACSDTVATCAEASLCMRICSRNISTALLPMVSSS